MDKRFGVVFPYCSDHSHDIPVGDFRTSLAKDKSNAKYFNILARYIKQSLGTYDAATEKRINKIVKELDGLGDGASLEQINDLIIFNLFEGWKTDYIDNQIKVSNENIELAYGNFRRDTSFFESAKFDPKDIPEAVFDVRDYRTIEYYKKSDEFYLGKFITDEDTRKRMSKFIKDEYIENNLPIGNARDKKSIALFREKFGDVLKGEDWKLVRIINTTVNRLRNHANVHYMSQAEITEFEIVGVNDRLQCPYCKAMQGKRFKVEKAVQRIENVTKSEPEFVAADTPFLVSVVDKPEDVDNIPTEELQDYYSIDAPPYHPHCRDRIVAVFTETETEEGGTDAP